MSELVGSTRYEQAAASGTGTPPDRTALGKTQKKSPRWSRPATVLMRLFAGLDKLIEIVCLLRLIATRTASSDLLANVDFAANNKFIYSEIF